MEKDQAGQSHNYPSHRKPYSFGRKGISSQREKMTVLLPLTCQHALYAASEAKRKR